MSYLHIEEEPTTGRTGVPRAALAMAAAMAVLTIALAAIARISHAGTLAQQPTAALIESRALVFSDHADGSIGVVDAARGDTLPDLVGTGGFVRGALRALARQRRIAGIGPEAPFYLARWSDGRLTLDDSATKNHLELQGFGPDNAAAFAPLLLGKR